MPVVTITRLNISLPEGRSPSSRYAPIAVSVGIQFIQAYMTINPRHGFGLLYASARHQSQPWGETVLWCGYCQLHLNLPRRGKKRLPARIRQPLEAGQQPNQGWSCDFMSDALWSGRRFRTFNVIDEFNWTYRAEVLYCYVFDSLQEVRDMTTDWLHRHNHHRHHEGPSVRFV